MGETLVSLTQPGHRERPCGSVNTAKECMKAWKNEISGY